MTLRKAGMSRAAAALYQSLLDEGIEIPRRETLDAYRDGGREGFAANIQAAVTAFDGDIEIIDIAGISCRQLTPQGWSIEWDSCILYAYGGGYISGSTCEDQVITAELAQHSGLRIVMVEYRLSPEHPYPLPQQDMRRVYSALLDQYGATHCCPS